MTRTFKHLAPRVPPGPACVVRLAGFADPEERAAAARLLAQYAQEAQGGEPFPLETAARSVDLLAVREGAFVLLASVGAQDVGMAVCLPSLSTFTAAAVVNIHDLWVDRDFRKRGIAAELLRRVQREAEDQGCRKVTLEVREDNPQARRLYRRSGFRGEAGSPDAPGTFFLELLL